MPIDEGRDACSNRSIDPDRIKLAKQSIKLGRMGNAADNKWKDELTPFNQEIQSRVTKVNEMEQCRDMLEAPGQRHGDFRVTVLSGKWQARAKGTLTGAFWLWH